MVAFDCDGVLFDTIEANTIYYNRILSYMNRPKMTDEQFAYVHMHTVEESIAYLFSDIKERAAAADFRKTMPYMDFIPYMKPEPYLKQLLTHLRPRRKTSIVTNRTDTMNRVLKDFHLEEDFDLVVTASDVPRPKPHPDGLIRVLDYFQVSADEAIYVGDSAVDESAAISAGVKFVAFGNPSLSAAHHVTTLREVEDIIDDETL